MRLQNLTQAKHFLNLALEKVRAESEFVDQSYTKSLRTTIRYNIARLSEEMYAFDKGMSFPNMNLKSGCILRLATKKISTAIK